MCFCAAFKISESYNDYKSGAYLAFGGAYLAFGETFGTESKNIIGYTNIKLKQIYRI